VNKDTTAAIKKMNKIQNAIQKKASNKQAVTKNTI
jgi:hypothetical protein